MNKFQKTSRKKEDEDDQKRKMMMMIDDHPDISKNKIVWKNGFDGESNKLGIFCYFLSIIL